MPPTDPLANVLPDGRTAADSRGSDRAFRAMLRKMREPRALERDHLANRLRAMLGASTAHEAVLEAIARSLRGSDARLAAVIRRCDIDGEPTARVARELGVSPRQFFRFRREALDLLQREVQKYHNAFPSLVRGTRDASHDISMGRMYLARAESDDISSALQRFDVATRRDPGDVAGWVGMAQAQVALARRSGGRARECVAKAREALASRPAAKRTSGVLACEAMVDLLVPGDAKASEQLAREAVFADPADPDAYAALGLTFRRQGRFEEAAASFARAIAIAPADLNLRTFAMSAHLYRGDLVRCVEIGEEMIAVEPRSTTVLGMLCHALNAMGRFDQVIARTALRSTARSIRC